MQQLPIFIVTQHTFCLRHRRVAMDVRDVLKKKQLVSIINWKHLKK